MEKQITYDINRPWLTLDPWQKEYINTPPEVDCFVLTGRQSGKTTAKSIKSVELCMKHFKKGEFVLINSLTEKQAYIMLAKSLAYAQAKYPSKICSGNKKPTMHKIEFKNGTGILCYAAGLTGEGLRGYTIKKHMVDEGARMTEEFFIATGPMMSVAKGSMDISSTPNLKHWPDGREKFFYKCSKDPKFKKFYVSAEDCPRHDLEFLKEQEKRLGRLAYRQEYLAEFTDDILQLYKEKILKRICVEKRHFHISPHYNYFLGVDVAGLGKDKSTYEIFQVLDGKIIQRESFVEKRNYTTETSKKIIELDKKWNFRKIGIDDGGIGFGVYSELLENDNVKRKVIALNNSSRPVDATGEKSKRLLKEEMYYKLMALMECGEISLLDDDEVIASLASIQVADEKIFGADDHIAEGIIRGVWLAAKEKDLNIFARSF